MFFDEIPDTKEQNDDFKAHLCYLQELQQFKKANIKIQHDDISEIDSHKHSIQQCMDIVLGAMAFRDDEEMASLQKFMHKEWTISNDDVIRVNSNFAYAKEHRVAHRELYIAKRNALLQ